MSNQIALNPFTSTVPATMPAATTPATASTDAARAVAEVQAALMIARMNPRDQVASMDRILNACTRESLANCAVYAYSKGGTEITGPSIRLAEAVAQQWGNINFGIRELSNSNGKSEVQAYAWDVETNTRREVTFTVPHMRYTRKGSYKIEDPREIYETIANQGSRRLRACILAVIPGDVIEAATQQCQVTMSAHADTSAEGIKKLADAFEKIGVSKAQLEARCQCHLEAIRPAQVVSLRKVYASIKDGFGTVSDYFADEPKQVEAAPKQSLKDKLKAEKAEKESVSIDETTGEVATK